MKKNIIYLILTISMIFTVILPVSASEYYPLFDEPDLLTDSQETELIAKLENICAQKQMEVVVAAFETIGDYTPMEYADDFYDQNGYGYGSNNTGILLLLDMDSREWYMSTCGDAIYIFTEYGLEQLGEEILPWLSDGEYYRAFLAWLSGLSPYVKAYRNGSPIDGFVPPDAYDSPYGDEIYHYEDHVGIRVRPFPVALVIGLIAALVTILVMRANMNTAKLQSGAVDYLKKGSFHLRRRSDMFLYSRVTKTARPKESSGGGGSSVHRSSGGVSHGGRGGKF